MSLFWQPGTPKRRRHMPPDEYWYSQGPGGVPQAQCVSAAQSEGGIYLPDIALSGQPTFCANLSSLRSFILLNLRQFTLFPQISLLPGCPQGRLVFQVFPHTPVFEHLSRHWCLGWLWKEEVESHWRKFYSLAIKSSASCAHYNVTRHFPAPVAMRSLSVMSFLPWWALVLWNRKPR